MAYTNPFWAASETEMPEKDYKGTGMSAIDTVIPGASQIGGGIKGAKDVLTVKRFDFSSQSPLSITSIVFVVVIIVAFFALLRVIKN